MKTTLLDYKEPAKGHYATAQASSEQLKLKDCCIKITDGSHFSPKSDSQGYPYVTVKDIKDDVVDLRNCLRISIADYEALVKNDCRPLLNDLLFSKDGTVGKVSLINDEEEFVVLSSIAIIRPNLDIIYPKYLFYVLKSRDFLNQALGQKKGVAIRRIILRDLKELTLNVPRIERQHQIVSKIEELFSELDKGIDELKTAQKQLKVYRQAVLKWAFEGRLTNKNVKEGELPEGWKYTNLSNISSIITKGASPKWQGISYVNDSSQVLFVTSENVRENYIDISQPKYLEIRFNEKQKRSILKKGDVLLNIVGATIGRAANYNHDNNANINQAVAVIRLNNDASNVFISYFLNSNKAFSYYNQNKVDFARANLSLADVSNIQIPLPPLKEQEQIVQEIESRLSVCDKIEETIMASLKQAEGLRQSILKRAFEGRLII